MSMKLLLLGLITVAHAIICDRGQINDGNGGCKCPDYKFTKAKINTLQLRCVEPICPSPTK